MTDLRHLVAIALVGSLASGPAAIAKPTPEPVLSDDETLFLAVCVQVAQHTTAAEPRSAVIFCACVLNIFKVSVSAAEFADFGRRTRHDMLLSNVQRAVMKRAFEDCGAAVGVGAAIQGTD